MSNLIKSNGTGAKIAAHAAPVFERGRDWAHSGLSREEDMAEREARVRSECEALYTGRIADAYTKGYADGHAEASAQAAAEKELYRAGLAARSTELLSALGAGHAQLRADAEHAVIHLALEIASRILRRGVECSSPVMQQIREALRRILGIEKVKIRINQADEELVRLQKAELQQAADSVKEFVVEVDDKVAAGGCILESELGNVDARLETQMKQIELALRAQSAL